MTASLRLKMTVTGITPTLDDKGQTTGEQIGLQAVYGDDGTANKQWSLWTPSGTLSFYVTNPEAFGKVQPGEFYFVDLTATDKDSI